VVRVHEADINVTPLIGRSVWLLLISSSWLSRPLTPKGLELWLPSLQGQDQQPDPNDRTVVVQIEKDHSIKIIPGGDAGESCRIACRRSQKSRAERVVLSKATRTSSSAKSRSLSIALKRAGIDKIGLMTPKIELGE